MTPSCPYCGDPQPEKTEINAWRQALRTWHNSHGENCTEQGSALERMEQRALGAEANLEAALKVSNERETRADTAEAAIARVRELARAWAQRGEHTMKYAATIPEDVRETIHDNGADMLDSARKIVAALDAPA